MTLFALGINHTTASLEVREKLAFAPEQVTSALKSAMDVNLVDEIAIMSTCNRTELYLKSERPTHELLSWLADIKAITVDAMQSSFYSYAGDEAARHMMKVASGLDSLVLGEPQILGQMKSCYAHAEQCDSVGSHLHAAFQHVFSVAKRVRSETAIGENPVSVAYAAVSLAQQIFSDLRQDTALLVGAGETIELVARHLQEQGVKKLLVANRTLERARVLADKFDAEALILNDLPAHLSRADIVISSTASPLPLIGKGMVEQAMKLRKRKSMFMVDIAVPRDIEAQVAEIGNVFLYTVDDLTEVIDENRRSREQAALIAQDIIDEGVKKYAAEQHALGSVDTIRAFRDHVEGMTEQELHKARRALHAGQAPDVVLEKLAHALSKKFMHSPTSTLRRSSDENAEALHQSLQKLFELDRST